jgi:hypothetical protein
MRFRLCVAHRFTYNARIALFGPTSVRPELDAAAGADATGVDGFDGAVGVAVLVAVVAGGFAAPVSGVAAAVFEALSVGSEPPTFLSAALVHAASDNARSR